MPAATAARRCRPQASSAARAERATAGLTRRPKASSQPSRPRSSATSNSTPATRPATRYCGTPVGTTPTACGRLLALNPQQPPKLKPEPPLALTETSGHLYVLVAPVRSSILFGSRHSSTEDSKACPESSSVRQDQPAELPERDLRLPAKPRELAVRGAHRELESCLHSTRQARGQVREYPVRTHI